MFETMRKTMLIVAAGVAVSSCASRERATPTFPSSADLSVEAEPSYPLQAFDSDEEVAEAAEDRWNDEILLWGRRGWDQVARICRWAEGHGAKVDCPEVAEQ